MKKNLLWMLAAILLCGAMTTSCDNKESELIPILPTPTPEEPIPNIVSIKVKYEASASETVMSNYDLIGTAVLIRYIDTNGQIKTEPFTGSFSKEFTIPSTDNSVASALQVLIVPKSKEDVADIIEGVDVSTYMKFYYKVNFDNGKYIEETLSTEPEIGGCSFKNTFNTSSYDNYVSRFGGLVTAMAYVKYYVETTENHKGLDYSKSAGGFWKENAYSAQ